MNLSNPLCVRNCAGNENYYLDNNRWLHFYIVADRQSPAGVKRKLHELENGGPPLQRPEPKRISLSQLRERHLARNQHTNPDAAFAGPASSSSSSSCHSDNRAVIFPENMEAKQRAISREFAQEFHESVLLSTRQKQEAIGKSPCKKELLFYILNPSNADTTFIQSTQMHLDTQALKNHPSGHAKKIVRNFLICQFQAYD